MRIPFTISADSLTALVDGRIYTIPSTDASFAAAKDHLRGEHDAAEFINIIDKPKMIAAKSGGMVDVADGEVLYQGVALHNTLTDKLLTLLAEGFDITPWKNFLENLMKNPSYKSRESLYDFLTHFNAPITEDGCFVAFKRVRPDFKDIYSGRYDNSPGTTVVMDRTTVDDDSSRTCSAGLHVAASSYLDGYADWENSNTVVCKVNPRDVVAVPYDYNFSKMRVCQYEVIGQIGTQSAMHEIEKQEVFKPATQPRDDRGRFLPKQ